MSTPSGDDLPPRAASGTARSDGKPAEALAAAQAHGARVRPIDPAHGRSHLYFKRFLGFLAIAFPFLLLLGRMLFDGFGMENSISDYYYTSMKNVLVGGLVALAILLICYRYARVDDVASTLAGLCAIGVAIFPTSPAGEHSQRATVTGYAHYAFAATFFLILAFYSIFIFTEPFAPFPRFRRFMWRVLLRHFGVVAPRAPAHAATRRKRQRNDVYLACGGVILGCIVLLLIPREFSFIKLPPEVPYVFWLETLAVCAFGFAWVVKGEVLLTDQEDPEPDLIQQVAGNVRARLTLGKR
jgi:hypothetical protein